MVTLAFMGCLRFGSITGPSGSKTKEERSDQLPYISPHCLPRPSPAAIPRVPKRALSWIPGQPSTPELTREEERDTPVMFVCL